MAQLPRPSTGVVEACVRRGGRPALRDLTLLARDGEMLAVLGPSGSGKTTLLRCIAGLDQLDTGRVLIRDRPVTDLPAQQRRAAMVFEVTALIPFLDVTANLEFGLRARGTPQDQVRRRVADGARRLGLTRILRRRSQEREDDPFDLPPPE